MIDPDGARRRAWLDYAWRVVDAERSSAHYMDCERIRGVVDERVAGDGRLRWPGSVNSAFRPEHGVLFVGSVHREFHIGHGGKEDSLLREQERRLVTANQTWRDTGRSSASDDIYLAATASAYEISIPRWPRGDIVLSLLGQFGDEVAQTAWVNLARCQAPPSFADEASLRASCQRPDAFPLSEVIDALRPIAVFVAVLGTVDRTTRRGIERQGDGTVLTGRDWSPEVFVFDGRQRTDRRHRKFEVWSNEAAGRISTRRSRTALPPQRA